MLVVRQQGLDGFRNCALHNLSVLLDEARLIELHLRDGTYGDWYKTHLDNTIYRPLIDRIIAQRFGTEH
jgi:hypothetical protein